MAREFGMIRGRRPFLAAMSGVAMASALGMAVAGGSRQGTRAIPQPAVLAFDGMETLLDLGALAPFFKRVFDDGSVAQEWFGQAILYSETATLTGHFTPFGSLAAGILRMLGGIHQVAVTASDLDELKGLLSKVPPHPDVGPALRRLKDAGFRLAMLTDSPVPGPGAGPLARAGLAELFESQFSAESVRQYKPARATYQMVAQELSVTTTSVCMVASHVWDLIGAKSAGCATALVTRKDVAPLILPGVPRPDLVGPTLTEVADALVALKRE